MGSRLDEIMWAVEARMLEERLLDEARVIAAMRAERRELLSAGESAEPVKAAPAAEAGESAKPKRRTIDDWLDLLEEYETDSDENPHLTEADFARGKGIKPDTLRKMLGKARKERDARNARKDDLRRRRE